MTTTTTETGSEPTERVASPEADLAAVKELHTAVDTGGFGCFLMFARQAVNVWKNARQGWTKPHQVVDQAVAD